MALFEYVIDETFVGRALTPTNGFLINLKLTQAPVYEIPEGCDGDGAWKRGYLQLKGSGDWRDLYCTSTVQNGHSAILNHSFPYRGDLVVRCVPRGGVFALTLSDQPVARTPSL